ncbi:MAG: LuxR C-terminal-related transcriptional regulator [Rickettsia endosymbiont of Ixodes persulcatus]|nr:LuxR C-terminal-related transcriptional regulator [Rickettsia endosymbiont of Ixodes persulcatus]
MANKRISLIKVRRNLIDLEEDYYTTAAHFSLLNNGVNIPSKEEISECKKYLNHTYLGLYILLEKPLTDRQIDILYRAACGEDDSKTANSLNISVNRVAEIRKEVLRRLNANNAKQALYRATCAGHLPAYGKEPKALKNRITKEVENASA